MAPEVDRMTEPAAALPAVLSGYPLGPLDEAVDPDGRVRPGYEEIIAALDGVEVDGELQEQPFPLDPIPRVLSAQDWAGISAGLRQRTRALNAFLDDVYGEQ